MTEHLPPQAGNRIISDLIHIIVSNRDYLSKIDGAIGDGDHGINMAKGFTLCGKAIEGKTLSLSCGFAALAAALMEGIGGSIGPLYGSFFQGMAQSIRDKPQIDKQDFLTMLENGLHELCDISDAKPGDKCLMDTLCPAIAAYGAAINRGAGFHAALDAMAQAAQAGRDATCDLVAKIGRASRLGERSRGVPDAGATSCCLLLVQLANSTQRELTL